MQDLITIIIPVFKVEKYIERCADSLFGQTYPNIEYIFVNDCTPDSSVSILRDTLYKFPHRIDSTHIIDLEKNMGHAYARNLALKQGRGKYVIQIDSDDWVELNMIEEMHKQIIKNDSDICACEYYNDYSEYSEAVTLYSDTWGKEKILDQIVNLTYFAHWNKLVKYSLIRDNNIYCIEGTNNLVDVGQIYPLMFLTENTTVVHKLFVHYNCTNINSQSKNLSEKRLKDIFTTVEYVSSLIQTKGFFDENYASSIYYLRFWAKSHLMKPEILDFKRWYQLWPDVNKYIWEYKISLKSKILYCFAAHNLFFPFKLGRYLQNNFK